MAEIIRVADLKAGDLVRLRKAHPCGGIWWLVRQMAGDVGLRCETCGRCVRVPRVRIERRIREIVRGEREAVGVEGSARDDAASSNLPARGDVEGGASAAAGGEARAGEAVVSGGRIT